MQPISLDYARPRGTGVQPGDAFWIILVTLFPVLVVAAAVGMRVATKGSTRNGPSFPSAARTDVSIIAAALDAFNADTGRYPTPTEGLPALLSQPAGLSGWSGPYLRRPVPKDPWKNAYHYSSLTPPAGPAGCQVTCAGPDGKVGTPDDIYVICP